MIRRGFTLIELMIAIGLGLLVMYAAFVGFRTTAKALSAAQRLFIGNALLRAEMLTAYRFADTTWPGTFATTGNDVKLISDLNYPTSWPVATTTCTADDAHHMPPILASYRAGSLFRVLRPHGLWTFDPQKYGANIYDEVGGQPRQTLITSNLTLTDSTTGIAQSFTFSLTGVTGPNRISP